MLTRIKYILISTFFICAVTANAQIKVLASINKQVVSINENLSLQVTVKGTQQANPPELRLKGFRLLQGPAISTQMSFINGKQESSVTFSYILSPKATGKQTIGPIEVETGKQKYSTKAINVQVVKSSPRKSTNTGTPGNKSGDNVFLQLQASRTNVYINEQILLTLTLLYKDVDITDVTQPNLNLAGFLVYDAGERPVQQRKVINSEIYFSVQFQKLLVPIKSGKHTIGPVPLTVTIRQAVRRQRRDDFFGGSLFDDLFGNYRSINKPVSSNPIEIYSSPLPTEGMPESFEGAVGTFSLSAEAKPVSVKAGEPVTLSVELSGEGNIDNASVTLPTNTANFRVYEPETTRSSRVANGHLIGKRTYKQAMVPVSTKADLIPAVRFSYFDVNSGKYVELKKGPFKINVKPAPKGNTRLTEFASPVMHSGSIKILNQDIFPIQTSLDSLGPINHASSSVLLYIILIVPPVLWIFLANIVRHRNRLRTDTALYRRTNASKNVRMRMKNANEALKNNSGKVFYTQLSDTMSHFIADKLHISAPQITANTIPDILSGQNIPDEKVLEIKSLLEQCDFGRFATTTFSENAAKEQLGECSDLINYLHKKLI